jgi:hypothetical protein
LAALLLRKHLHVEDNPGLDLFHKDQADENRSEFEPLQQPRQRILQVNNYPSLGVFWQHSPRQSSVMGLIFKKDSNL